MNSPKEKQECEIGQPWNLIYWSTKTGKMWMTDKIWIKDQFYANNDVAETLATNLKKLLMFNK